MDTKETGFMPVSSGEFMDVNPGSIDRQQNQTEPYTDAFTQFMRDLGVVEKLDKEREIELVNDFKEGLLAKHDLELHLAFNSLRSFIGHEVILPDDNLRQKVTAGKNAKDELVTTHIPLLVSRAKAFQNKGLPLIENIQNGALGLLRSVEKFDPNHNVRLVTYAQNGIDLAIRRGLANQSRTIRLPVEEHNKAARVRDINSQLFREHGSWPSIEELAVEAKVTPNEAERYLRLTAPISLDMPSKRYPSDTIADTVVDPVASSTEEHALLHTDFLNKKELYRLAGLTEREEQILELSLRPDEQGRQPTQTEVAEQLGFSRQYVSKVLLSIMPQLREAFMTREKADQA